MTCRHCRELGYDEKADALIGFARGDGFVEGMIRAPAPGHDFARMCSQCGAIYCPPARPRLVDGAPAVTSRPDPVVFAFPGAKISELRTERPTGEAEDFAKGKHCHTDGLSGVPTKADPSDPSRARGQRRAVPAIARLVRGLSRLLGFAVLIGGNW